MTTSQTHVIPASDSGIRGQATAGIHFAGVESQWIPACAGMTTLGIRVSCTLVELNKFSQPPGGSDDEANTKAALHHCARGNRDIRSCTSHGNQSELPAGALLGAAVLRCGPAGLVGGARAESHIQHFSGRRS